MAHDCSGRRIIWLDPWVDTHEHLRNSLADGDGRMEMIMRHIVGKPSIIFHIGNGNPAILNQTSAEQELAKAYACLRPGENLEIHPVPLLRNDTTPEMIFETRMANPRIVLDWKGFLSGVSNDGGNSVSSFDKIFSTIAAFYKPIPGVRKMVASIHAERKTDRNGKRLQMRDREWYAIKTDVAELLQKHPLLTVVIKHVSDWRTLLQIMIWRLLGYDVYAEICPHYLYRSHEDLYEGSGGGTAFNLHDLCWPLYKSNKSTQALRAVLLSKPCGFTLLDLLILLARFFPRLRDFIMLGLDFACHNDNAACGSGVKVNNDGTVVGGVTVLPEVAISLIIDLFFEANRMDLIDSYISGTARKVYGLAPAGPKERYVRDPKPIPMEITGVGPNGSTLHAKPFMRGKMQSWHK